MILSPLPAHQRKRRFHLFHGELMEEDDFETDETAEEEIPDDDFVPDEVPDEVSEEVSEEAATPAEAEEAPKA
jgi:hypothetical protein